MLEESPILQPLSANCVWVNHLKNIKLYGEVLGSHGTSTVELLAQQICLNPEFPVLDIAERKLSKSFMFCEAAQILRGENRLNNLGLYAPKIKQFTDIDGFLSGAYGPKFVDQLPYVIRNLMNNYYSRQAVMTLWRERPEESKDIPCTVSLQFLLRKDPDTINKFKLITIVNMRSSDAWLGLPYDMFCFTAMGNYVRELFCVQARFKMDKVVLGEVIINMGSAHIYNRDMDKVTKVLQEWRPVGLLSYSGFDFNKDGNDTITNLLKALSKEKA